MLKSNPAIATADKEAKATAEATAAAAKPKPVPFYKKKSVLIGGGIVLALVIGIPVVMHFVKKGKKK